MNNILVISANQYDETYSCGGTLLKHKFNNDKINLLICAELKEGQTNFSDMEKLYSMYPFDSISSLGLQSEEIDKFKINSLKSKISKVINKIKPNIVYLPSRDNSYSIYDKIFEASYDCAKTFEYPFVKKIYMMETLKSIDSINVTIDDKFIPNVLVNIDDFIEKKIQIVKEFEKNTDNEKNIRATATLRGYTEGKNIESFILLKEIN
jgi:N-acetylglucosamine malate deacetylase 1